MKRRTVEEIVDDFDNLIEAVEHGEIVIIEADEGQDYPDRAAIVPYAWYKEAKRAHGKLLHERLWALCTKLESDYEPYGKEEERVHDCSCGCKHYLVLEGDLGMDWGICSNPKSPRKGLLTFEHQNGRHCFEVGG